MSTQGPVEMIINSILTEAMDGKTDSEEQLQYWLDRLAGVLPVAREDAASARTLRAVLKCVRECRKNDDWYVFDALIEASGLA